MYDDISGNADQFARSLDALGKQIEEDIFEKVIKKSIFDLVNLIVTGGQGSEGTPRETQRARAAWMIDTQFSDFAPPPGDYTGVDMGARIAAMMQSLPRTQQYVIFNNLEYIVALENGHSQQAPSGFVAQALAAMASIVAKRAKEAGFEGNI